MRVRAAVTGVVQGVGFRPYLYRLAREHHLAGTVANDGRGVALEVEGEPEQIEAFFRDLIPRKPPLAHILRIEREEVRPRREEEFRILPSRSTAVPTALVPPDVAVCDDCLREMRDPGDRRHNYPFINCTNCGPRYTIIQGLPYDRPKTTMFRFQMCPLCLAEYHDPVDRRFHAQPNACPVCGPRAWLADAQGRELEGQGVIQAGEKLAQGAVVAIKGLGGFHLACDAFGSEAVTRLRERKGREQKPLAVMVKDLDAARSLVRLSKAEEELLLSPVRPIILAGPRQGRGLAPEAAPGLDRLGIMIAYTPLHHLLFEQGPRALVMTSGNLSDEPIAVDNQEALDRLGRVADYFLLHNREIHTRADDSVAVFVRGYARVVRRSRGYAPRPVMLETPGPEVLALGPELKNTICLTRGRKAFLSAHVGDLKDAKTHAFFQETVERLQDLVGSGPEALACDLHPDFLSTREAESRAGLPLVRVQHHVAHVLAVMAERGLSGPAVGLALDGVGLGLDQSVWGGEVLLVSEQGMRRLGRIRPFRLPGGDAAAKEPWRSGCGLLRMVHGDQWAAHLPAPLARWIKEQGLDPAQLDNLETMMVRGVNSPWCTSAGRLFDGVAVLAGLRFRSAYEGQAAMELEARLDPAERGAYEIHVRSVSDPDNGSDIIELDPRPMLLQVVADLEKRQGPGRISARFHNGLIQALAQAAQAACEQSGCNRVVLCGGCFMNRRLLGLLPDRLLEMGLEVYANRDVPCNDGGVSLGQALAARIALAAGDETMWTRETY